MKEKFFDAMSQALSCCARLYSSVGASHSQANFFDRGSEFVLYFHDKKKALCFYNYCHHAFSMYGSVTYWHWTGDESCNEYWSVTVRLERD